MRTFPHSLQKLARLSADDRRLLIQAAPRVALARVGLWLLPLSSVRWLVTRKWGRTTLTGSPQQVVWAVGMVSRYIPQSTCLVRALATQGLLAQSSQPSQLHVGVALDEQGKFQAHAWVEHQGRIIIGGTESDRYTRLLTLNAAD
jgi:Transglutaminase-like superfamily